MPTITELEVQINSQRSALTALQWLSPEVADVLGPSVSQKKQELEATIVRLETDLKALEDEMIDSDTPSNCNGDQPTPIQEQETTDDAVDREKKK